MCWFGEHRKTRTLIRVWLTQLEDRMTEATNAGFARLDASFEGLSGDIAGLKLAGQALTDQVAQLLAGQDAAVEERVNQVTAEFNERLATVAARFEGLDAETPPADGGEEPPAEG